MSTKPATLPTWNTGGANRSAPSGAQEIAGSATGDQLPSGWLNYWLYWIFSWLEYVRDAAFTSTTGNGASGDTSHNSYAGLSGVHAGSGAGVQGTSVTGQGGSFGGATGVFGIADSAVGFGLHGQNSAGGICVYGEGTDADPNPGVYGSVTAASGTDSKAAGVKGTSGDRANATFTYGVIGEFRGGGSGGTAAGVFADGSAGTGAYGLIAKGSAVNTPLRLVPQAYTAGTGPSGAFEGDIFFNGTDHKLYFYNGSAWVSTT